MQIARQPALFPTAAADVANPYRETGYIYFVKAVGTKRIKIGQTYNLENRLSMFRTDSPIPVELIDAIEIPYGTLDEVEYVIHGDFCDCRIAGEWFEVSEDEVKGYIAANSLHDKVELSTVMIWIHQRQIIWWQNLNTPIKDYLVQIDESGVAWPIVPSITLSHG